MNSPALSQRRSMTRFTQQVSTTHFPLEATPSWRSSLVHPQSANSPFFYVSLPHAPLPHWFRVLSIDCVQSRTGGRNGSLGVLLESTFS